MFVYKHTKILRALCLNKGDHIREVTYEKKCYVLEAFFRNCSVKKVFLKNSQNSQENICVRVSFLIKLQASDLFFNKVAGLKPATLLKKRLWHRCFLMNFEKFLRKLFLKEHWLLTLKFTITNL